MRSKTLCTVCVLLTAVGAKATTLTFDFTDLITGIMPSSSSPVATLTIQDVGLNTVHVTLSHNAGSASGQFITGLWFNLNPLPTGLVLNNPTPANKFDGASSFGLNTEQRAGLNFDAHQGFETSGSGGGVNRLKPGENVFFELSGLGLDASDFLSTAVPTGGQRNDVIAMIHVQGIATGESSGHVAAVVPEPLTFVPVATGLMLLGRRRSRQNR